MIFAVEVWTVADSDNEEPCDTEMVNQREFSEIEVASAFAWQAMEEGFFTRMWRREHSQGARTRQLRHAGLGTAELREGKDCYERCIAKRPGCHQRFGDATRR